MSKLNDFARAVSAKNDLETCESLLNLARAYADPDICAHITAALREINERRTAYIDMVSEARAAAQQTHHIFIGDRAVEVPNGYTATRVSEKGELRINVFHEATGELKGQIMTANRDGSDVGGFVVWRFMAAMPELHTSEAAALNFFFEHYAE